MAADPVRYAVVGVGYISQSSMLPAFRQVTANSRLAALVSGDARKREVLAKRYRVPIAVGYGGYDRLLRSGEIDAVYIGLPNTMHRRFAERAARRGIHVLCDKPLAMTEADCRAMIEVARRNDVQLMTAYRLHFEPGYLAAMDEIHSGRIGDLRFFASEFSMQVRGGNIRGRRSTGGGPLYDLGTYCVNAARHVFRAEPIEAFATMIRGRDRRFRGVEDTAQVQLRFPGDMLASFTCSFAASDASVFQVWGAKGSVRLEQAYEMVGEKTLKIEQLRAGKPATSTREFAKVDQFAPLLATFSEAVRRGRQPEPSGEEGLADIRVHEAIVKSARTGRPVTLARRAFQGPRLTSLRAQRFPAHREPDYVNAAPPSQG